MVAVMETPVGAAAQMHGPGDRQTIDALVHTHAGLVRSIAYHMLRRMPRHIDADDLIQTGMVGLLEAAQRYRRRQDSSFANFASSRIRGAMLDMSRSADWCSRSARRRLREIDGARMRLEQETGTAAQPRAIAAAAGITLAQYFCIMWDIHCTVQLSLDKAASDGDGDGPGRADAAHDTGGPAEELMHEESIRALGTAVDRLPERERAIFLLYHEDEHSLREIGMMLAISESRVCQIHKQIIVRLRAATR